MKLNHKLEIDLKQFIRTGKFDYLKLGMTKEEVLKTLPEPEDHSGWDFMKSNIWYYGNFELHFKEDQLFMMFTDHINSIDGGATFKVDTWIIGKPEENRLINFMVVLIREKIDFVKITNIMGQVILKGIDTGIKLVFDLPDRVTPDTEIKDPNDFELVAITRIDKNA